MRIAFVPAARFLADDVANGEALAAAGVLRTLADRGHDLLVYCERAQLATPLPNAEIVEISASGPTVAAGRLAFANRIASDLARRHATERVDVAHLLLPITVDEGYAPRLPADVPLVVGPVTGSWSRAAASSPRLAARATGLLTTPLERRRHRRTLAQATMVLAATRDAREQLPPELRDRSVIRSPGVDARRFAPEPLGSEPVIGFLSVLHPRKGIEVLLDAFGRVRAAIPAARLLVCGEDPDGLRAGLERRAPTGVTFLGGVAPADTPAFYARCQVFCQPSLREPFGATVLEAMATARPVVAFDAGGPADTIVHGETGFLVPLGDAEARVGALADALIRALADPGLLERMGKAGRARVGSLYDLDVLCDDLEAAYAGELSRAS